MAGSPGSWLRRRVHILARVVEEEPWSVSDPVEDQDECEETSLESLRSQTDEVLATLSRREAQAIELRFGLDDGVSKTLKDAGGVMGISAERVRQLEVAALRKLREPSRRTLLQRPSPSS